MKKIMLPIGAMAIAATATAQAPHAIPYQAVARSSSGVAIATQPVGVRFSIHDIDAAGTVVYSETHLPTTSAQGLFAVQIGQGTPVSGTFAAINWGTGAKYLQVEIDPAGGTTYTDMGTTQLMSVPYALYAETTGSGGGHWTATGDEIRNANAGSVVIGNSETPPAAKLHVMGSTALGENSVAGGLNSVAMAGGNAVGEGALAIGNMSGSAWEGIAHALGNHSFAVNGFCGGDNSVALGYGSVTGPMAQGALALGGGVAESNWSVAIGRYTETNGSYAWGSYATALAGGVASADHSVAIGIGAGYSLSSASGNYSTAIGGGQAAGASSLAIGYNEATSVPSIAFGNSAVAIGGGQAAGNGSVAIGAGIGAYANAVGDNSVAIGQGWANGNRSFAMNFGNASGEGSFAWSGIASGFGAISMGGTANGDGSYSFAGDATGNFSMALGQSSMATGNNSIAMLAGYTEGTQSLAINEGSITGVDAYNSVAITQGAAFGEYSFAANGGTASGSHAVAIGGGLASGDNSMAFGGNAYGNGSIAFAGGTADAGESLAIGNGSTVTGSGYGSTAIAGGQANGSTSVAIGYGSSTLEGASGAVSIGMGAANGIASMSISGNGPSIASGYGSTVLGGGFATAENSTAIAGGTADAVSSVAIGGWVYPAATGAIAIGSQAGGVGSLAMHGGYAAGYSSVAIGTESFNNSAHSGGAHSLALGAFMTAAHDGSFVLGDHSANELTRVLTTADNQMMMRFAGGYKLYTNAEASVGAEMAAGGNSWSTISDRRKKENFAAIDGEAFLKKIAGFKLTSWNYKGQNPATHRHYGPMAQDFYAAFGHDGYGTIGNDTTINQADMEGVTFTAVQALEKRTQEIAVLKAEIEQLKNENRDLKASVTDLSAALRTEVEQLRAEMQAGKISGK